MQAKSYLFQEALEDFLDLQCSLLCIPLAFSVSVAPEALHPCYPVQLKARDRPYAKMYSPYAQGTLRKQPG